jgi:hypothetical protein
MKLKNLKTVAQEQSLSIHTLRKFARQGMPHYRVGRKIMVDIEEFQPWFVSQFRPDRDRNNYELQHIIDDVLNKF